MTSDRQPRMDGGELLQARLADALASVPEVVFGYLFGSVARGRARPDSDVDVAVYLEPAAWRQSRSELTRRLLRVLGTATGERLDLAILNEAGPLLAHRVLRDGKLVICRDSVRRVRFAVRSVGEYLDTIPMRAVQRKATRERILKGRGPWSTAKPSSAA